MTIPGYDPEDLDDALEARLSRSDVASYLTDAELRRYDDGESLVDLLDDEDIHRLLDESDGSDGDGDDGGGDERGAGAKPTKSDGDERDGDGSQ